MSRESFVQCAQANLGKRYVWGTAGPDTFDCSGYVAYCWEQTQHEPITRSSVQQYQLGESVPVANLQPGDLVFWSPFGNHLGHVAIYEGGGKVLHALNETRGVVRSDLLAEMGGPMVGARRLFSDGDGGPDPEPPKRQKRPRRERKPKKRDGRL